MDWTMDRLLPQYDKREQHDRWIAAPPGAVWEALTDLRAHDLGLTVALTRLRGGPAAWGRDGAGPLDVRVLDSMAPRELAVDPPREVVLGDIARYTAVRPSRPDVVRGDPEAFAAFDAPGWSKVVMNFRLVPEGDGTRVTTETRVRSTDGATRRAFARYWLVVRAGSGLMRRDILQAVDRRARRAGEPGR
ncbi:hypothetical protein GCM10010406_27280 [Streptomyces thermolineatus]|uniref:SRPBCC family protein n=1 Tax=Streptomyces thermolineatus TaxID=44033 RepID=A0ABN3LSW8_9ACTN